MNLDRALDDLYDHIDEALTQGRFTDVDQELGAVDVAALAPAILIGWLSITGPARDHLPGRATFAQAVRVRLASTMPPDELEGCLRGLE